MPPLCSRPALPGVASALALAFLLAACGPSSAPPPAPSAPPPPSAAAAPGALPAPAGPAASPAPTSAVPAATPPGPRAPAGLSAAAQSPAEVALSWSASAGDPAATAYEVYRGETRVFRTESTRVTDGGLRPGTRYCYTVRAVDAAGRTSPPTVAACALTLDNTPPTAPSGVAAVARPGNAVEITWKPSTDDVAVVSYDVIRADGRPTSVRGTSFLEEKLAPAREHCFVVRALDAAGNRSDASAPACATVPDTTPPSVPQKVAARAAGEHAVELSWEPSTDDVGVALYELRRPGAEPVMATATASAEKGLRAGHAYCWAVRACDAAGNCSTPAAEACATTPDLTPPVPPASLSAEARSDVAVELAWPPAQDEVGVVGYEIRRGDAVVARAHRTTAFTDGGLRPGTEYCYAVTAFDAAGLRAPPVRACARTLDLTPPTVPGRPAAVAVSSSQLFLAWDPSTDDVGVLGYEVVRDGEVVARVAVTRARERKLPALKQFCYTVRAYDAAGNRSEPAGPFCGTTADPSALAAPSDLRVVRVSTTDVILQWEPSEQGGVLYRVYATGDKSVGMTRGNTFNPSGRMGAKADCYRVAAVDDQGRESGRSNEVCAILAGGPVTQR